MVANTNKLTTWKSKGYFDESIKPPSTSDDSLNPVTGYINNAKIQVQFDGYCLKQDKATFIPKAALSFYFIKLLFLFIKATKILILISILNPDMVLDLIHEELCHWQMVEGLTKM